MLTNVTDTYGRTIEHTELADGSIRFTAPYGRYVIQNFRVVASQQPKSDPLATAKRLNPT